MLSNLLGLIFPYLVNPSYIYTLILSFIFGLIIILIYTKVLNKISTNIFNTKPLITVLLKIINIIITAFIIYRITIFISNEYLPETPTILILSLLYLPTVIASFKNKDVIIRCSSSIIIIAFMLLLFSKISLISKIDINNFKPLIYSSNIFKDALIISVLNTSPIFTTLFLDKEYLKIENKNIIISYILSYLVMIIIFLNIIGVLGIHIASIYKYPSYITLKNINILNFIKNVQNLSVVFWIMFSTFTSSFNMMYIKEKINKMYIIPVLIMIFILSYIFIINDNYINKVNNLYVYIPFTLNFIFIILSFIAIKIKK